MQKASFLMMRLLFAPNVICVSDALHLHGPSISNVNREIIFSTVYHRIYCHKFLTLSNQTSHYICKCMRIYVLDKKKKNITIFQLKTVVFKNCSIEHRCLNVIKLLLTFCFLCRDSFLFRFFIIFSGCWRSTFHRLSTRYCCC